MRFTTTLIRAASPFLLVIVEMVSDMLLGFTALRL